MLYIGRGYQSLICFIVELHKQPPKHFCMWNLHVMPSFQKETKHKSYVCLGSPHIQQQNRNIRNNVIEQKNT
jgi:hypothetical protein